MIGIRWHSRAGHGAITAANALCEIVGENSDYEVQSFPDFGAEKKGAAVVVYNRFSSERILETHHIQAPNIVLLLDASLINPSELKYEDVLDGIDSKGDLILNTLQDTTQFNALFAGNIWHLKATPIAEKEIGRNIPNVPMLGALIKISGLMDIEKFIPPLEKYLSAHLPPHVVAGNLIALRRGYDEVKQVKKI